MKVQTVTLCKIHQKKEPNIHPASQYLNDVNERFIVVDIYSMNYTFLVSPYRYDMTTPEHITPKQNVLCSILRTFLLLLWKCMIALL